VAWSCAGASSLDDSRKKAQSEFVEVVEAAHTVKLLNEGRFSDVAVAAERQARVTENHEHPNSIADDGLLRRECGDGEPDYESCRSGRSG
jgi:hypothetical protein